MVEEYLARCAQKSGQSRCSDPRIISELTSLQLPARFTCIGGTHGAAGEARIPYIRLAFQIALR